MIEIKIPADLTKQQYLDTLQLTISLGANFASFVVQDGIGKSDQLNQFLKTIKPWIIKQEQASEWPGTRLLERNAMVYSFKFNEQSLIVLQEYSVNFESWLQPDLPEDLCVYRPNTNALLTSISHEGDFFLSLTNEEAELSKSKLKFLKTS
jgi:hypothetical protein